MALSCQLIQKINTGMIIGKAKIIELLAEDGGGVEWCCNFSLKRNRCEFFMHDRGAVVDGR